MSYSNTQQQQQQQQSQHGGNRNSVRTSNSLFLDVIDDNARWRNRASLQRQDAPAVAAAAPVRSAVMSFSGLRGGDDAAAAAAAQQQTTLSHMLATGQTLGLDRALPAYDVAVVGAEQRKDEGGFLGLKGAYVDYILQTTRLRDSAVALTRKRYSVIRAFFEDLLSKGIIPKGAAPAFPPKEAVGHNSDVKGAFICRRRAELQSWLQRLFAAVPALWDAPSVRLFFCLDTARYGTRYIAPPDDSSAAAAPAAAAAAAAQPGAEGEGGGGAVGWNPYTMASQAAAAVASRMARGEARDAAAAAAAAAQANPQLVQQFCEMGFAEAQARAALEASKNDPQIAMDLIITGAVPAPPSYLPPPPHQQHPPLYSSQHYQPDPYAFQQPYQQPPLVVQPLMQPAPTPSWLSKPPPPPPPPAPAGSSGGNQWFSKPQAAFASLLPGSSSSSNAAATPAAAATAHTYGSSSARGGGAGSAGPGTVDV